MATHGQDPLYLGCSENVLALMDRKCSGRSECDIRIPDPELDGIKPCYRELIYYLEISYTCVPGRSMFCTSAVAQGNNVLRAYAASNEEKRLFQFRKIPLLT